MPPPPTVAEMNHMLVDTMLCVGRGVGAKNVSIEAAKFWAETYAKSIAEAIINGGVYKDDRDGILLMAIKLGREAKKLAGVRKTISLAIAKKASENISKDPTCTAGGGRYCPI
jgi:hypothetical protein